MSAMDINTHNSDKNSSIIKKFGFIFFTSFLIAVLISKIISLQTNTLSNNGSWNSSKTFLAGNLMGSNNFFNGTQALNSSHLDLSDWHGFQEIITKKTFEYNQIELDVFLKDESYLFIHWEVTDKERHSLRLESTKRKSECLVIDPSGKYLSQFPIENLSLTPHKWSHIKLTKHQGRIEISIDGDVFECPNNLVSSSRIGFKGGYHQVLIDNITLKKDESFVFKENFSNHKNPLPLILVLVTALSLGEFIIYKKLKYYFPLIAINFSIILVLMVLYFYLLLFFSGNYPNFDSFIAFFPKRKEQEWSNQEVEKRSNNILNQYKNDPAQKIMFIGSSQTWGAGSSSRDNSFPEVFQKIINKYQKYQIATESSQVLGRITPPTQVINAGIDAQTSNELLEQYETKLIDLHPDTLVINLSSNDFDYNTPEEVFRNNLEKFVKLNQSRGIKTILLSEANSIEKRKKNPYHQVVKEVAKKNQLLVVDMNEYLKSQNETGIIWWDFVHPTDYGHKLIAKHIWNTIKSP